MRRILKFLHLLAIGLFLLACNSESTDTANDTFGLKTTPDVDVNLLQLTPSNTFLLANATQNFDVSGGTAPYSFTVSSGSGTIVKTDANSALYTAPNFLTAATVRVTDGEGNQAFAAVTVGNAINLTPSSLNTTPSTVTSIQITGGDGSYTCSNSGGGAMGPVTPGTPYTCDYTAPAVTGSDVIIISDSSGNSAFVPVIISTPLTVTPSTAQTLGLNETLGLTVSNGTPPYIWTVSSGIGSVTSPGASSTYTAPNSTGAAVITVTDSAATPLTTTLNITVVDKPVIAVDYTMAAVNGTLNFSATGGVAPYTYSVISGGGSFVGSVFTAPATPQTVTVQVDDSTGGTPLTDTTTVEIFYPKKAALGVYHSCFLDRPNTTSSSLKCVGANGYGYVHGFNFNDNTVIGDDPTETGDNLATLDFGTGVTVLRGRAGSHHGCAIMSDYTVKCWGYNTRGTLHNGSSNGSTGNNDLHYGYLDGSMGSNIPTVDLGTGRTINNSLSLDAVMDIGYLQTCAILDNDELRCWGSDENGSLGLNTVNDHRGDGTGELGDNTNNVNFGGASVSYVSVGYRNACAIVGTLVFCWGNNDSGQLGYDSTAQATQPATPVSGLGFTPNKIDSGYYFNCASSAAGDLKCWGENGEGQLGQGSTTDIGTTGGDMAGLSTIDVGTGRTVSDFAAGFNFVCALDDLGNVKCWGDNSQGQLGIGSTTDVGRNPGEMGDNLTPVSLGTGRTATNIWASRYTACAELDNGDVKCWGDNTAGSALQGHSSDIGISLFALGDNLSPINFGTGVTATHISHGEHSSCATLDNNTMKCWGRDQGGSRGLMDNVVGDTSTELGSNLTSIVLGSNHIVDVSAWYEHTCVVDSIGEVYCWGDNSEGQLGLGNTTDFGLGQNERTSALPLDMGTGRTATSVYTGFRRSCAILDDNTTKCWGRGDNGALMSEGTADLGNGAGEMGDSLNVVDMGTGRTAVQIAPGTEHMCGRLDNGLVKCWGDNGNERLGVSGNSGTGDRGNAGGESGDNIVYAELGTGRTATDICVGETHSCAVLDNGTVKCWGDANYIGNGAATGNLGNTAGEMGDNLPTVNFGTGRTATKIACGTYHTCVLMDNKKVKCWGEGSYGRLGYGDQIDRGDNNGTSEMGDNLPEVDLGTNSDVIDIFAGYHSTCALLWNNEIKCWGRNRNGNLGQGHGFDVGSSGVSMGNNLPVLDLGF